MILKMTSKMMRPAFIVIHFFPDLSVRKIRLNA